MGLNPITPAGRAPELLGTLGLFLGLSTITTALRVYCRTFVVKNFGVDDWLALLAYMIFVLYSSFAILGCYHGTGQHADHIPLDVLPHGLKWWWLCEPTYVLSLVAMKLSIGIFLLRIAVSRTHKIIIWVVLVVHTAFSVFFFFLFILQCRPSAYFWTKYTGGRGTCIDANVIVSAFYAYSAISCAGDWILGIIPVFIVWNLQMNWRTKMSVATILAVGAIASSATIIRIPYISGMSNIPDFLWATTDVAIWSTVEGGIGITASAAATLRPLFRKFFQGSYGTGSYGNASGPWTGGYVRSGGRGMMGGNGEGGVRLRSDVGGKATGTVTTIRATEEDEVEMVGNQGVSREGSLGSQKGSKPSGFSAWQSDLEEGRSDSGDEWKSGIVKTTRTTQVRE